MFLASLRGRSAFLRVLACVIFLQCIVANAQVTRLSFRPIDAAYSKSLDRLILVSENPNQLHIYNVTDRSDQTVALGGTPLKLSVSPDGTHAAVGFSTSISYVDLQGVRVERTFTNGSVDNTTGLLLGPGYVYTFPKFMGYAQSINLSTGELTYGGFANADGLVFNSSLSAIYTTSGSLARYDASGGLAYSRSQSYPYSQSFYVCGPLSLSEAEDTIYTGCGTAFRASNDASKDMTYAGMVPGVQRVQSLVQSGTLNQIAVVPQVQSYVQSPVLNDDTVISLFDARYLNLIGQLATTSFTVNASNFAAHGRWLFYNASSSALIVITQADPSAALTQNFAVENIDLRTPNSCNAVFGSTSASVPAAGSYATAPVLSGQDCLFTAVTNDGWITLSFGAVGSGNTSLTYLVRPNLSQSPRSGTISIGSQVFTINQDGQADPSDTTALSIRPVSAEYDKALDRIVMVSASPNELHLYDPLTQADDIVHLNSIPLSVSVRPDGLSAAVGHSGSISIVDLQTLAITQTVTTESNNAGVILAANGYVYSFPSISQPYGGSSVNSIKLSDNSLTSLSCSSCVFPLLMPSGDYIYTGNSYGGYKLDITGGAAILAPSVGSSYGSGSSRSWLSESGGRILNSYGNAFLTSNVPALDLSPNGHLSGSSSVASAANSQQLQRTAVLTDVKPTANTQLQLYSDDGLQLLNQLTLPGFTNGSHSYLSHGRYVFWNAAGTKLFAITQADTTSGLLSDYAIYTVNSPGSLPACSYSVSPLALTVPSGYYGTWFLNVTSNCTWSPIMTSTGTNWLYLSTISYTTGDGTASFSTYGTTGSAPPASIKIGDKTAIITQAPASCTYSISATSRGFSQAGGNGNVYLATDSNCPWSIESNVPWLTVAGNQSGTGPVTVSYSVESNTTAITSRSGTLNIAGKSYFVQQTTIPVSAASYFVPITPCRIADTRNARGPFGGPFLNGNTIRTFSITSSSCSIPTLALAYSLNITVVPGGPLSYVTAWPANEPQPFVSTLNSIDGRVKANAAIIDAGLNKAVSFYTTDPTDLIIDVTGYFVNASSGRGLSFYPLTPCRVSDTRDASARLRGPELSGGETRQLPILLSGCNINPSAQAYSFNYTAIPEQDLLQYLTTWPAGQNRPVVSTLNSWTGSVTANAAILQAGAAGDINVYVTERSHLAIDTNGYFAPPGAGGLYFYSLAPCRVLDTRISGNGQPFQGVLPVQIGGACNIPSTASAVVVNSTVVPVGKLDYLTLWPSGSERPVVSSLNAYDGSISSNMAIVPLSDGSLSAFATDKTHLILDVTGYFAP